MLPEPGDGDGEATHIAPRREHNSFAPVRRGALHCYGVDFLSNKEVLEIFTRFKPQNVEWLDDSSCNVVFADDDEPTRVLKELAAPTPPSGGPPPEHWTVTKPLTVGPAQGKQQRGGKARQRSSLRTFRLELRPATEADRKDPGHSGHTDSIYYAHVKEQQALQKQEAEMRRMKKRQRRSRLPSTSEADLAAAAAAVDAAMGAGSATSSGAAPSAATGTGSAGSSVNGQASPPGGETSAGNSTEGAAATTPALPKLGLRGFLDPLLFLRAGSGPNAGAAGEAADGTSQAQRKNEDLLSALRRAEAEYTAVVQPEAKADGAGADGAAPRERGRPRSRPLPGTNGRKATPGRGRRRTPGGSCRRERTPPPRPAQQGGAGQQQQQQQQQQYRGKKRRPVEQEPRAVSSTAPPPRKVCALPEVEAFLAEHRVRCQRYQIRLTFRSIKFGQQKKPGGLPFGGKPPRATDGAQQAPASKGATQDDAPDAKQASESIKAPAGNDGTQAAETATKMDDAPDAEQVSESNKDAPATRRQPGAPKKELPPWERYLQANHFFTQQGHFMHTVAWEVDGRHILTVVPHPKRVDLDRLARAVQKPRGAIRQRKLKDIEKQTGWPVFVCPPFGHPKDSEGRTPMLLVDSTTVELKKPLLFDCGSVGLSVPVSEFFRSTGAACIEGLARDAPAAPAEPVPASAASPAAPAGTAPPQAAGGAAAPAAASAARGAAPAQAAGEPAAPAAVAVEAAQAQAMEV
uniref:YbaK/aminoacyl-tRNA synthetase-associated domain-containing protein n=1 Tax=Alexandrium monilatum TaxID=311494 RepID=A0A7S4V4Z0_9DINO